MRSPILAAILLVSLILAFVIGMVFVLRSAGSSAPIDSLPRDTSFLVRAIDPPKLWRDLSRTRLTQRAGDETLDWLARLVSDALERRGLPLGISSSGIAQAMRLESLVALVPGDAEEPHGLALVVDLGTATEAVPEIARSYVRTALGARGDGAWVLRSHHGREYLTLHLPGGPGGVSVAGLKGLGIVTTSGASLRRILDTLDGRADPLRSDPAYRTTRDHLGKRADLLAYVSGSWLRDQLEQRLEASKEQRLLKVLGLSSVRAVGLEIDLVQDQFKERLFVAMQRENRGLMAELFKDAPRAPGGYRSVPAGFPFYLSLTYTGLDTLYRKLPEIVSTATGEDRRTIHDRIAGFEEFMALDFGSELFAALGHDLVVGFGGASPLPRSAPNRVILNTPAVAAISLRDQGWLGACCRDSTGWLAR